jgi:hypothetical protein
MKDCLAKLFRAVLSLSLLSSLLWVVMGQTAQPPTSTVVVSDKTGKEAVCDGAAEIIPSGQQTFVRKRYVPPKAKTRLKKPRR